MNVKWKSVFPHLWVPVDVLSGWGSRPPALRWRNEALHSPAAEIQYASSASPPVPQNAAQTHSQLHKIYKLHAFPPIHFSVVKMGCTQSRVLWFVSFCKNLWCVTQVLWYSHDGFCYSGFGVPPSDPAAVASDLCTHPASSSADSNPLSAPHTASPTAQTLPVLSAAPPGGREKWEWKLDYWNTARSLQI